MTNGDAADTCSCKIGRNIKQYNLDNLNAELRHRRLEEEASLRDLADYVNQRILVATLMVTDIDVNDALYGAVSEDVPLTTVLWSGVNSRCLISS